MIEVTFRNKETKRLYEHEVLEEIEKIMPIPCLLYTSRCV